MALGSLALSFAAGALSTLSPCVLPLLPIVLASSVQKHALGPLALAAGLSASFAVMGILVAALGFGAGIDAGAIRFASAVLMLALGIVLLVPSLFARATLLASPVTGWAGRSLQHLPSSGATGQLLLGLALGVVWSPCAGPTLGAAIGLAAQSETMSRAAIMMLAFSLGAATPLLALAYGSRQAVLARRDRLSVVAAAAKPAMGVALALVGVAILTGLDKALETQLTDAMPQWLLDLTTRY